MRTCSRDEILFGSMKNAAIYFVLVLRLHPQPLIHFAGCSLAIAE